MGIAVSAKYAASMQMNAMFFLEVLSNKLTESGDHKAIISFLPFCLISSEPLMVSSIIVSPILVVAASFYIPY